MPTSKPAAYNVDAVVELLSNLMGDVGPKRTVPILDEQGVFTGQFYDPQTEVVPDQPSPQRFVAHLEYLKTKTRNRFEPTPGRTIPEFDPYEQFQSEGFFNSLGNIGKTAWMESLTGEAERRLTGEEPSGLGLFNAERMRHWEPNPVEAVAAQVGSFAMPLDLATLYLGGGAGTIAAKAAAQTVGKAALKRVVTGAIHSGTTFGTYEGARAAFSGEDVPGAAAKGFGIGSIFGVVGQGIASDMVGKAPALSALAQAGGEIFTLGTIVPVIEGRTPTIEDLGNAAGFIAGLRAVGYFGEVGKRKFARMKMKAEEDIRAATEKGEEPNQAVRRLANDAIMSQPERFNTDWAQRIRTAATRMSTPPAEGQRSPEKIELGTIGDFIKDPKVREAFAGQLDTKVSTRLNMPEDVGRVLVESGGGEATGWIEGLGTKPEIVVSAQHPDVAGLTIVHEAQHLLRSSLGRPVAGGLGPVAERSAERVAQFVGEGGAPSVPKARLKAVARARASQRAWENRIATDAFVKVPVTKLTEIGAGARPIIAGLMAGSPMKPSEIIVMTVPSTKPLTGPMASVYGPGRSGVVVGEVKVGRGDRPAWTVLDISAPTEAGRIEALDDLIAHSVEVKRPVYLSRNFEGTPLLSELQRTGKVSRSRTGKLYKLQAPPKPKAEKGTVVRVAGKIAKPKAETLTGKEPYGIPESRAVKAQAEAKGQAPPQGGVAKAGEAEGGLPGSKPPAVPVAETLPPKTEIPFRRQVASELQRRKEDLTATRRVYKWFEGVSPKAAKFMKETAQAVRPTVLDQTRKQVKDPEAKKAVSWTLDADSYWHVNQGRFSEQALDIGLRDLGDGVFATPKKRAEHLTASRVEADRIEAGDAPEWNRFFKGVADFIRRWRPDFREVKNYLPRRLTDEIKRKLYREAASIDDELMKLREELDAAKQKGQKIDVTKEMDRAVLERLSKASAEMQEAMKFVTDPVTGQIKGTYQGLKSIRQHTAEELTFGASFLKKRKLEFPSSFYERDIRTLIPEYITEVTRWAAEQEHFGPDATKLNAVLKHLRVRSFEDAEKLQKIISMWSGKYEVEHGLKPKTRQMVDAYVALQVATKIGLGGATILNLAQPLISIIPELGAWNFVKGGLSLMDPSVRQEIRMSGAATRYAIQAVAGHHPGGFFGKVADFTTTVGGFQGVNKGLQYLAAATLRQAIPSWQRLAAGTGARAEWTRMRLNDFGINWTQPLASQQEAMARAMYRFATDSQLQKNILNEPFFFNDPRTRPLVLFKRFGYRQANYMKDMLNREVGRGNVAPIIRLAAGGWLGGTGISWSLNKIKSILSGEPYYRQDDSFFEELITDLATIGAFGVVSDMANVTNISRLPDAVRFAISPVMVSDIETVLEASSSVMGDWQRYGDAWLATKRNLHSLAYPIGTYPRALSKRAMTTSQKFERLDYRKNKELGQVYRLILEGNASAASDRIANWNSLVDDDLKFGAQDLSLKKLSNWIDNRAKSYALAVGKEKTPENQEAFRRKRLELREQLRSGAVGIRTVMQASQ